jgi:hypothetical protein
VNFNKSRVAFGTCFALLIAGETRALAAGDADADQVPPSRAANPLAASSGPELGVRLGLAHPGGMVGGGATPTTPYVGEVAQTWLPVAVDGGYRISPGAYVGATLQWGAVVGDSDGFCEACGFRYDFQAKADLRVYPFPTHTLSPWVSLGAGWEVLHLAWSDPTSPTATYQGPVLGSLEIGLDVRSRAIAVGPYFGFELAEFVARSLHPAPAGEPSIDAHAVHEWFTIGVRGSYGPWALSARGGSR